MTRPLLLDLFCGAGGAGVGYHRAGFDVVGVDIQPQPHYPFPFIQGDALAPPVDLTAFDVIHASPPCQYYSHLGSKTAHWRSIPPTRELLLGSGRPFVIENIRDAIWDMRSPVQLCGSSFDLGVRRHRMFESSLPLMVSSCLAQERVWAYYGRWSEGPAWIGRNGQTPRGSVERASQDMGIDWMTWDELREAIPPAYTEFIGRQLLEQLERVA